MLVDDGLGNGYKMEVNANHQAEVALGGHGVTVSVPVILTTGGAIYAAGDFVGITGVAVRLPDVSLGTGRPNIIRSAALIDGALQSVAAELWLFDTAVTPPADGAAFTITDAMAATLIGVIPFTTYFANAANSVCNGVIPNNGLGFVTVGGKDIWGCLVTRGAPNYASLDVTVRLFVEQR